MNIVELCTLSRSRKTSGFSLVEIVIAIGIVSFALVAILGMFPIAMRNAQESQRETRATFIAQQLFASIQAGPYTNVRIPYGTNSLNTVSLNLQQKKTVDLASDNSGVILGPASAYDQGGTNEFLVRIQVDPNTGFPNLSRVEVEVSAPGNAPLKNRSRYNFVTLISGQE